MSASGEDRWIDVGDQRAEADEVAHQDGGEPHDINPIVADLGGE